MEQGIFQLQTGDPPKPGSTGASRYPGECLAFLQASGETASPTRMAGFESGLLGTPIQCNCQPVHGLGLRSQPGEGLVVAPQHSW
jgi:hypothetical protein